MNPDELIAQWRQLGADVFSGMADWHRQHPRPTLQEIEAAADARLSRLRAQMIADIATASPMADWSTLPQDARPTCPQCHLPLRARGQHHRQLQTYGGAEINLQRSYGTCPQCGAGLFPPR